MDETMAVVAFNPRTVQQALHALQGTDRSKDAEAVFRDLKDLARALAKMGNGRSADVTPESMRKGTGGAVLKRAATLLAEKGYRDLGKTLDLQAEALERFESRA